jgi:hypothetical protein
MAQILNVLEVELVGPGGGSFGVHGKSPLKEAEGGNFRAIDPCRQPA